MNWQRWIRPGIVATVVLGLLALLLDSGGVERDLAGRVTEQLAADGQSWATVDMAGRSVTIVGTAPSVESQELAVQSARGVPGIRTVADRSQLLPVASPYVWSARKAGRVVTLTGNIPSEAFRNSVLAAARRAVPDAALRDEMRLARGSPTGFNGATGYALDRLADLADGMVTLTESTLSVTGVAANAKAYVEARAAFGEELPSAVTLGPVDLKPARADPFMWSATYDGKSATLSGYVPNEVVHETLVATAKAALSPAPVVDQLTVASGEPKGFAEATSFAITALTRFSAGGVTLDGLTLDIAGKARSVDDYEAVMSGLSTSLPAGFKVVSNSITPATVTPYGWQGEKDGSSVVLSGYVPSQQSHDAILAMADTLFAGAKISDRVRVAAGEPRMDWIGAIKFAMSELAKLGRGKVVLGGRSYSIEGEAASPEAFAEILATNEQTLPASLEVEKAEVLPPRASPYRFAVESGPASVTLVGYAPSSKDKRSILDAAKKEFGSIEIADKLAFASGAPESFVAAATGAFAAVTRLAGGRAEIVDNALTIEGGAFYQAAAEEIANAAADALPEGFAGTTSIMLLQPGQPVPPERCRDLLQEQLRKGRIEFSGTKADIADESFGLLDRVATIFSRCADTKIEVGAHSNSDGSSSRNRDLTQARAEAIVDYLVDAGVERERVKAVGYGEDQPIADNTTKAGKSANRRIEFTVALPEGG